MRGAAALALGEINDARAIESLNAALKDVHPSVREEAAEALGMIMDVRAIEPLIALLNDKELRVQVAASNALVQIKDERAVEPLLVSLKKYGGSGRELGFIEALVALGPIAVEDLNIALTDKDQDIKIRVAEILWRI